MVFDADVLVHRERLHRHCARMLGCPVEAEDALQETLLRAWRARRSVSSNPRAWVFRIATNVCVDALNRRVATVPFEESFAPSSESVDAAVLDREALASALADLPPSQRAAFVLRDVLCWSARDTACVLSVSVPAANSALQRARSRLRQCAS